MQANPPITPEGIVIAAEGVLIAAFFALRWLVKTAVMFVSSSGTTEPLTPEEVSRHSRVSSASIVIHFVSLLLTASAGLTLAMGSYKPFAAVATLFLPDRSLGLTLLIGYAALFAAGAAVGSDLKNAGKSLFAKKSAAGKR